MPEQTKHVLLREDLEPAFDEVAALAAMETIAEEAGDWRGHIPYAAARIYRDDPDTCALYESHVDECTYCRRLIDALNPAEKVLDSFHELLQHLRGNGDQSLPEGMATSLANYASEVSAPGTLYDEFLIDPEFLQALEVKEDVTAKFQAARIYFDASQQTLAYKRIAEGCALANVDRQVIDCLYSVTHSLDDPTKSLTDNAHKWRQLVARRQSEDESRKLQVFQVLVRLGRHHVALVLLHDVLMRLGGADEAVEALEAADLGAQGNGEQSKWWFTKDATTGKKLVANG